MINTTIDQVTPETDTDESSDGAKPVDIADAELIWPGTFVAHGDEDDHEARAIAHDADTLLFVLDGAFTDALLALACFGKAVTRDRVSPADRWERDMAEQRQAEEDAWQGRPDPMLVADWSVSRELSDLKRIEGERLTTRRLFARGELPRSVTDRLPFIYARAFVFALDYVAKTLKVLSKSDVAEVAVVASAASADLDAALPALIMVRDSAHHPENRARGLDRRGRPIVLQPVDNGMIHAPGGGVRVIDCLNGTRYSYTVEDGRVLEVDVNPQTLFVARDAIQQVLNGVPWRTNHVRRSPMV